jgi:pescadillo protein
MRIKKKGTTGNAKNFITRTQAVKKLQLSLADFRRLCIFKGIYPREPRNKKKANKGSTAPTTFYYYKDIQYLLHEPVLQKFREHKSFSKKLNKALGRGEVGDAKRLEESRPRYKLDHVIKERYPTFLDALRDIDDALNMLFLFAIMPATDKVSARVTKDANEICNQWLAYVSRERALRKVFVSIKGVYYEAVIKGVEVRWLVPFKYPQNIPSDIDFKIMLTFLEFYSTLLHFVLYKLYTDVGLVYPPRLDMKKLKGVGGLSAYILESQESNTLQLTNKDDGSEGKTIDSASLKAALEADQVDEEQVEEDQQVEQIELDEFQVNKDGDLLKQPSKFDNPVSQLFSSFIFFIGREVPIDILEFLILSCGGQIISELTLDELKLNNEDISSLPLDNITHQIVDRPKILGKVQGRTYVQPQWIFDCVNKAELLAVNDYLPGETLPPHLSPWGDAGGYDPEAALPEGEDEEASEDKDEEDLRAEDQADENEDEDEDLLAQKELEMEAQGVKFSDLPKDEKTKNKKRKPAKSTEDEEKELKMIMMTNKQKKLYKKMKYSNEQKENRSEELRQKKRKLEKTKQKLEKK